jgi:hypothetical protein
MKTDGSNDAQTETDMFAMPITRRVTVLHRILRNSFVIQQNAVNSRQHIKSYSSMLHTGCVFNTDPLKIVTCGESDFIMNKLYTVLYLLNV